MERWRWQGMAWDVYVANCRRLAVGLSGTLPGPRCGTMGLVTSGGARAREVRASYSFLGVAAEMDKTVPLAVDERVLTQGTLRVYRSPLSQRITYLRLTAERICLVEHHLLGPDRVTDVPRRALQSVEQDGARVNLTWVGPAGEASTTCLVPWSGRSPVREPYRDLDDLGVILLAWQRGA